MKCKHCINLSTQFEIGKLQYEDLLMRFEELRVENARIIGERRDPRDIATIAKLQGLNKLMETHHDTEIRK